MGYDCTQKWSPLREQEISMLNYTPDKLLGPLPFSINDIKLLCIGYINSTYFDHLYLLNLNEMEMQISSYWRLVLDKSNHVNNLAILQENIII